MLQTACHDWHAAHGGRMVDFAGWHMPVQYSTITEEHHAVRKAAGLFDVAHMGRIRFTGKDAAALLDSLVTNDVAGMSVGQVRYALVTNEQGGILDDVLVYRFPEFHQLVVNASNRLKILAWLEQHRAGKVVDIDDRTEREFMFALQGPKAVELLRPFCRDDISQLKYYTALETVVDGHAAIVSRTGYTGEDGFEVIVPGEVATSVWSHLIEAGKDSGLLAAGLAARDTLRLEAGMPLYGHELDEQTDPYTAGLGFGVKLQAADFIGKQAVAARKADTNRQTRVGLELSGKRIAREGALVMLGDREMGRVTSGTFSPTLEKSIAMAYVAPDVATVGESVEIDIRGKREAAKIVALPFYRRG